MCLFAQYHPAGRIPPQTRRYLTALYGCGLRVHVAANGMAAPHADDVAFLDGIGARLHRRVNRGLDFGAWRHLLRSGCAAGAARIYFANDSVFGPYGDLASRVAAMNRLELDAWGMVESRERVWHLQSWFVCLTKAALARRAVQRVFAQDFDAMTKEEVILHGELGLGVALRAEGLRCAAIWPERSRWRRLMPVNPSHFDFLAMLRSGQVPFIKAELLRDNPANIAWIGAWRNAVAALAPDGPAEIDHALGGDGAGPWRAPLHAAPLVRRLLNAVLTADRAAALRHLGARS